MSKRRIATHLNKTNGSGKAQPRQYPERMVWLAIPHERTTLDVASDSINKVMLFAGRAGFGLLSLPYQRTDAARNNYTKAFLESTEKDGRKPSPMDTLIMFDNDHRFPPDIALQLAARITDRKGDEHGIRGVVGALAFKRGEPFEPCFFKRGPDGNLHSLAQWTPGMYEGQVVGHAAVAIARWVFEDLMAAGKLYPFWRYTYKDGDWATPSEDMYFARICEDIGVSHWCDMTLECPHLILSQVDKTVWDSYLSDNMHLVAEESITIPALLVPESGAA